MNPTKIEWCHPPGRKGFTWNPMTGCLHGCDYCYAGRIAERFRGSAAFPDGFDPVPRLDRIEQPARMKTPSFIFVGSMTDIFGNWWEYEWIDDVLQAIAVSTLHRFVILTKNPKRVRQHRVPKNCAIGVSAPNGTEAVMRVSALDGTRIPIDRRVLSLEPMQTATAGALLDPLYRIGWLIVGLQTGPGAGDPEKIRPGITFLVNQAQKLGLPVFVKDNCGMPDAPQEWPEWALEPQE